MFVLTQMRLAKNKMLIVSALCDYDLIYTNQMIKMCAMFINIICNTGIIFTVCQQNVGGMSKHGLASP